jgi:class 3 adenylate cyclase/tetratricopeptide (TPR) repeat protein
MDCPHCRFSNPPGMKFCGGCGARLVRLCAQCGVENPQGFKFCGGCGAPLAATAQPGAAEMPEAEAPAAETSAATSAARTSAAMPAGVVGAGGAGKPPARPATLPEPAGAPYTPEHLATEVLRSRTAFEGERKQVTVLFCDLVGSTELADRVGPEAMHGLLRRFFELALAEVHRYGGTINQFLGDGFMALFGAPVAHEDHARRAVLASLGVRRAVEELRAGTAPRPGPHPAADLDLDLGPAALGALACRMGLNTGKVVVGGIGDHLRMDYTAVGDTTNLAARLQQLAAPGDILISNATRSLVEDEVLCESLGAVTVKGKAGPVTAFRVLGRAGGAGASVLSQRELSPFVGRQPELAQLAGLVELAAAGRGQVVGIAGDAGAGKSRLLLELRNSLRDRRLTWFGGRCLSYGGGVPYLPLLDLLRNACDIGETDPTEVVAAKAAAGLAHAGVTGGESLPYLLELLGVHGGGEAAVDLGSKAIQDRTFAALRRMILHASRSALVVVQIEDLHWVDPTSEEFLESLVEEIAGVRLLLVVTYRQGYHPRWLDKSYGTRIRLRPLSTSESRELAGSALRRAAASPEQTAAILERAEGNPFFIEELAKAVVEQVGLSDGVLPATVQGVLMARSDRLPDGHKRLLQTAAVLGRELSHSVLAAVWERPEELGSLLQDLKRWEFLVEVPAADGQTTILFRHALTQEAVYHSLLTGRRRALHAAAGRALESLFAGRLEDAYAGLAYHFPRAGEPVKAVEYLARSAEWWALRYAHPEAVKALEEALRQAEQLPEKDRDRCLIELVLQLARSLLPLARFPETLDLCLRHRERVERLADASLAAQFHFWLAHTYSYLGDQARAALSAERAIALAEQSGDDVTLAKAHYVLARDGFWSGRFAQGVEHALRAVALLERHGERWWKGQAHWVAGFNDYALGRFEPALEAMARAHAIGEALADPRLDTTWSTGYFYASMGECEAAIRDCRGGLERSRDPLNTTAALGFLGYAYLQQGDLRQAVASLEPAVESLRKAGFRQMLGWFGAFLAEAYLLTGRTAQGRQLATEALAIARETRFGYGAGLAQRAMGRIERQAGTAGEAAKWLEEALATFAGLEARFEVGRTHLDLGALALARGDAEGAERHQEIARAIFVELRVPRYLERAEELAAQIAGWWLDNAAGAAGGAGTAPHPES